jgi:molybdenum cofactor synthesis domain-containing protein
MLRVALVVISSKVASGIEPDVGRPALEEMIRTLPGQVVAYEIVPDERKAITEQLQSLCEEQRPDVLLTVGGTGVRPSDWAPEATRDIVEKEIPGIGEAMRQESLKKVRTAMLSRGTAGIRGGTLIVNLPGSSKGAKENLGVLLPILDHTVEKIRKVTSDT